MTLRNNANFVDVIMVTMVTVFFKAFCYRHILLYSWIKCYDVYLVAVGGKWGLDKTTSNRRPVLTLSDGYIDVHYTLLSTFVYV